MTAPGIINDLVERFARQREAYLSPEYKEAHLRQEFINPFFEALGWDLENRRGFAEPYKEVIHEDAVRIGGYSKAPDYSFRVGGKRVFFVGTKKPAVNLKENPEPAIQLRRYAWTAKLPLSVLTSFEGFALYDCRIRPTPKDRAATGRIEYLSYQQYPDEWDRIAGIFSRDAVLKGLFDQYAQKKVPRRGTAEVDQVFLKQIEKWREVLAKNLAPTSSLCFRRTFSAKCTSSFSGRSSGSPRGIRRRSSTSQRSRRRAASTTRPRGSWNTSSSVPSGGSSKARRPGTPPSSVSWTRHATQAPSSSRLTSTSSTGTAIGTSRTASRSGDGQRL